MFVSTRERDVDEWFGKKEQKQAPHSLRTLLDVEGYKLLSHWRHKGPFYPALTDTPVLFSRAEWLGCDSDLIKLIGKVEV
jgi:hypothetical protein